MRESDAGGTHACRMECEIVMIFPKKDLWIHRWLKAIVVAFSVAFTSHNLDFDGRGVKMLFGNGFSIP